MAQRNISFAEKRRRFDIEDRKLELEIVELVRAMTHLLREDTQIVNRNLSTLYPLVILDTRTLNQEHFNS